MENQNNNFYTKLAQLQKRMKVEKANNNSFGNYNYRNIEQILAVFKELNTDDLTLTFNDALEMCGDRNYVKSVATITDGTASLSCAGFARESAETKGKMDVAQLTGSCSSYARKYAVCGLLLIDDNQDVDSFKKEKGTSSAKFDEENFMTKDQYEQIVGYITVIETNYPKATKPTFNENMNKVEADLFIKKLKAFLNKLKEKYSAQA